MFQLIRSDTAEPTVTPGEQYETYFLNMVDEADLLVACRGSGGGGGSLLLRLEMCGGAGWYFKIYRPKQEKDAEPEEDYGDELEDYDGGDDMPPWDEEDHEEMEDEE